MNNMLSSQCQFDDAFYNKDSKELDKMARQINNKNKKKSFKNKFNNVVCDQMSCDPYSNKINFDNNYSFFSTQGDFSSSMPTPLTQPNISSESESDSESYNPLIMAESESSFGSLSSIDNNSISSTYSLLPQKIKKQLKMKSNHLNKYYMNDKNDNNTISHLQTCEDCKNQLISLLKNTDLLNEYSNNQPNTQNSFLNLNITTPELKDVIVLILVGIIIIVIIDILRR